MASTPRPDDRVRTGRVLHGAAWQSTSEVVGATYRSWRSNRTLRLGAGLAYYGLFTIVPLLTLSLALSSAVFSTDQVAAFLSAQIKDVLGQEAAALSSSLMQEVMGTVGAGLGLLGLGALLFAASVLFVALQDALNVIWHAPYLPGFRQTVRRRMLAFGIVLLAGSLLVATFALATMVGAVDALVPFEIALLDAIEGIVVDIGSWMLLTAVLSVVFRLLPPSEVRWRDALVGALVTTVALVIGARLVGVYFDNVGARSLTGAAGGVLLSLGWIYVAAQIVLAGAELTCALDRRTTDRGSAGD